MSESMSESMNESPSPAPETPETPENDNSPLPEARIETGSEPPECVGQELETPAPDPATEAAAEAAAAEARRQQRMFQERQMFEYRQVVQMLLLRAPRVRLDFGTKDLICLIAQLQLALRHPANRSQAAKAAWTIKEWLIGFLDQIQPGMAQHLRRGDGSYYDHVARAKRGEQKSQIIQP